MSRKINQKENIMNKFKFIALFILCGSLANVWARPADKLLSKATIDHIYGQNDNFHHYYRYFCCSIDGKPATWKQADDCTAEGFRDGHCRVDSSYPDYVWKNDAKCPSGSQQTGCTRKDLETTVKQEHWSVDVPEEIVGTE
jgi:hypothetical protein